MIALSRGTKRKDSSLSFASRRALLTGRLRESNPRTSSNDFDDVSHGCWAIPVIQKGVVGAQNR